MTDPNDLLLSDSERLHALMALGDHYASGRLDDAEFHARSGDVAASRTLGQLRGSFVDLPGGTPLTTVDGMIVQSATATGGELEVSSSSSSSSSSSTSSALSPGSPTGAGTPAARGTDADLEDLRRRPEALQLGDGAARVRKRFGESDSRPGIVGQGSSDGQRAAHRGEVSLALPVDDCRACRAARARDIDAYLRAPALARRVQESAS